MEPIVRNFVSADVEKLSDMVEYTIDESYKWVYKDGVRKYYKQQNTSDKLMERAEEDTLLVAVEPDGDRIIGTGSLTDNRIYGVYVHPDYQGNGVGVKLMKELENKAIEKGQNKTVLNASVSSREFYSKLGYKGEPKIEKTEEGNEYVVYRMEKYLA